MQGRVGNWGWRVGFDEFNRSSVTWTRLGGSDGAGVSASPRTLDGPQHAGRKAPLLLYNTPADTCRYIFDTTEEETTNVSTTCESVTMRRVSQRATLAVEARFSAMRYTSNEPLPLTTSDTSSFHPSVVFDILESAYIYLTEAERAHTADSSADVKRKYPTSAHLGSFSASMLSAKVVGHCKCPEIGSLHLRERGIDTACHRLR